MNTTHQSSLRGMSPLSQLGLLIALLGVGFILAALVSVIIIKLMLNVPMESIAAAILDPKNIQVARFVQFASTFFLFALPAVIFAKVVSGQPARYLGFTTPVHPNQFYIVLLLIIAALFAQSTISQLNEMIPISKSLETTFKRMEDEYAKEVLSMAQMKSFTDYLYALIILAFLPALFEEMFFRGALQQMFVRLFSNAFAGILITSLFFSAAHFSFYGFLTRLFLGLLLGYIFHYGKNIWLNITAHFLNNAVVVTSLYILSRNGKLNEESLKDENYPLYIGIFAIIAVFALFVFYKRESLKVTSASTDESMADWEPETNSTKESNDLL